MNDRAEWNMTRIPRTVITTAGQNVNICKRFWGIGTVELETGDPSGLEHQTGFALTWGCITIDLIAGQPFREEAASLLSQIDSKEVETLLLLLANPVGHRRAPINHQEGIKVI